MTTSGLQSKSERLQGFRNMEYKISNGAIILDRQGLNCLSKTAGTAKAQKVLSWQFAGVTEAGCKIFEMVGHPENDYRVSRNAYWRRA